MAYFQTPPSLNRNSWGPISVPEMPGKLYDRPMSGDFDLPGKLYEKPIGSEFDKPISGNFDRIINAFERTNAFQYVRSTFERAGYNDRFVHFENAKNEPKEMYPGKIGAGDRFTGHGDVLVNTKKIAENNCSTFDRADGRLASRQTPCSDEDVAEYYQERMLYSQARQLFPLQEDLADWINKTIGITYLTGDNFLDVLDNGAELCELAIVIRDKAKEMVQRGKAQGPVPTIRGRCWKKAARRSFFSRDNMENFITFCRELGVHENLLFESDDLVLHAQPRQVVLCLLEVARLATKYDVEPPGLVQLEREIAMEENDSGLDSAMSGLLAWQFRDASPAHDGKSTDDSNKEKTDPPPSPTELHEDREGSPGDDGISAGSGEDPEITAAQAKPLSELDKRVQLATRLMQRKCNCSTGRCSKLLKVKKVGEGRYNIAGRNVFIRLLKGRHMMVRVGGGWDTLEHFLSRHDPCQVRLVTPSAPTATSPNTHTITTVDLSALSMAYSSEDDVVDAKSKSSISLSHSETSSDGKKTPPRQNLTSPITLTAQAAHIRRQSLTLPLKSIMDLNKPKMRPKTSPSTNNSKRNSIHGIVTSKTPSTENNKIFGGTDRLNPSMKSRSMSLTSPLGAMPYIRPVRSPVTPKFRSADKLNVPAKKSRSSSLTAPIALSPTSSMRTTNSSSPKFCGTDRLNAAAKKSRSASLTSPVGLSPTGSVRSIKSPGAYNMSQSFTEVYIKSPLNESTPNKPAFLQIKAKYRSPPPRETSPR